MEDTRRCTKCLLEKPIDEFNLSNIRLGHRRHECKACESERKKNWYNANHAREAHKRAEYARRHNVERSGSQEFRTRNRKYQRDYRQKLKAIVYDHYGHRCACCGETEPLFLSIDHVNNDGYALRKYNGHPQQNARFLKWLIDNNFPDDFQILCMNCNFGKSKNGGICPHQQGSTTIPQGSTSKRTEAHRTHAINEGDDMVSSAMKVAAASNGGL